MLKDTYCDYCGEQLSAGREFVYQYESLKFLDDDSLRKLKHLDDETLLASIRESPDYLGEPLRVCQRCSLEIEANRKEVDELQEDDESRRRWFQWLFGLGFGVVVIVTLAQWIRGAFF